MPPGVIVGKILFPFRSAGLRRVSLGPCRIDPDRVDLQFITGAGGGTRSVLAGLALKHQQQEPHHPPKALPRPSSRSSVPEGLEQHIDPEQVPARTDLAAWRYKQEKSKWQYSL